MSKWSVIMLSYLGTQQESDISLSSSGDRDYSGEKFMNAVSSFIAQDYENKELVIISDGCEITNHIYYSYYADNEDIKLVMMPKSPPPPPPNRYRQAGIVAATGNKICYLDPDDCLFPFHLTNLEANFSPSVDWICFPYRVMAEKTTTLGNDPSLSFCPKIDLLRADPKICVTLKTEPGYIGGGNIAHKRNIKSVWGGTLENPGRNGDLRWILDLMEKHPEYLQVGNPTAMGYLLCQTRQINHNNNIVEMISKTPESVVNRFNGMKR